MSSEKVEILKLEYQLLTDEINSRIKFRFALLSLIIALLGYLFKDGEIVFAILIGVMLFAVWARMGMLIYYCALHLKQVETRINEYSNPEGDPLLTWYTKEFTQTWLVKIYEKIPNRSGNKVA